MLHLCEFSDFTSNILKEQFTNQKCSHDPESDVNFQIIFHYGLKSLHGMEVVISDYFLNDSLPLKISIV